MKSRAVVALLVFSSLEILAAELLTIELLEGGIGRVVATKETDWKRRPLPPYPRKMANGVPQLKMAWVPGEAITIPSADDVTKPHPLPDVWANLYLSETREKVAADHHDPSGASTRPRGVVKNLGEEAHIWGPKPNGNTIIRVRTGRAFIEIGGPSVEITMRFAELIVREVESEFIKAGETQ